MLLAECISLYLIDPQAAHPSHGHSIPYSFNHRLGPHHNSIQQTITQTHTHAHSTDNVPWAYLTQPILHTHTQQRTHTLIGIKSVSIKNASKKAERLMMRQYRHQR